MRVPHAGESAARVKGSCAGNVCAKRASVRAPAKRFKGESESRSVTIVCGATRARSTKGALRGELTAAALPAVVAAAFAVREALPMARAHGPRALAPDAARARLLRAQRPAPPSGADAAARCLTVAVARALGRAERLARGATIAVLAHARALAGALAVMIAMLWADRLRAVGPSVALGAQARTARDAAVAVDLLRIQI